MRLNVNWTSNFQWQCGVKNQRFAWWIDFLSPRMLMAWLKLRRKDGIFFPFNISVSRIYLKILSRQYKISPSLNLSTALFFFEIRIAKDYLKKKKYENILNDEVPCHLCFSNILYFLIFRMVKWLEAQISFIVHPGPRMLNLDLGQNVIIISVGSR